MNSAQLIVRMNRTVEFVEWKDAPLGERTVHRASPTLLCDPRPS